MGRLSNLPLFVLLMAIGAIAMLLPAAQAVVIDQHRIAQPFFYSAILFGVLAMLVGLATYGHKPTRVARGQLLTLVAAFALLPVMLAVPMYEASVEVTFFDVYFEMVSSMTTTGASVFDPAELPDPLHLWRALVGWLGGFLMLLTAVAILAPMNLGGFEVLRPLARSATQTATNAEQAIRLADPSARLKRNTMRLFPLYLGATLVLWLGLVVLGLTPFVAICVAFSTLSTSGILPVASLPDTNPGLLIEMLVFGFLIVAISRQTLSNDLGRSFLDRLWLDREVRLAFVFILVLPGFLFLRHWIGAFEVDEEADAIAALRALWGGFFTVMSFITTTGFASAEWETARSWSGLPTPGLVLAGLAIIGGGVATTAGGVKLLRVYALYKHGLREMELLVHPSSIGTAGYLGREVRREGAFVAWIFFMLFALSIALVIMALAYFGLEFEAAAAFAISALSTTGPLAPMALESGPVYADLSIEVKTILIGAMVLGRLETLAIIALFNPDLWRG